MSTAICFSLSGSFTSSLHTVMILMKVCHEAMLYISEHPCVVLKFHTVPCHLSQYIPSTHGSCGDHTAENQVYENIKMQLVKEKLIGFGI